MKKRGHIAVKITATRQGHREPPQRQASTRGRGVRCGMWRWRSSPSRCLTPTWLVGHKKDLDGPLFRPLKNNVTKPLVGALSAVGVCPGWKRYAQKVGLVADVLGVCAHSMRATAATNALDNRADIAKVQEWLGRADISTIRMYDKRLSRPENSLSFKVRD